MIGALSLFLTETKQSPRNTFYQYFRAAFWFPLMVLGFCLFISLMICTYMEQRQVPCLVFYLWFYGFNLFYWLGVSSFLKDFRGPSLTPVHPERKQQCYAAVLQIVQPQIFEIAIYFILGRAALLERESVGDHCSAARTRLTSGEIRWDIINPIPLSSISWWPRFHHKNFPGFPKPFRYWLQSTLQAVGPGCRDVLFLD